MQNFEVLKSIITKGDCRTLAEFFVKNEMCPQQKRFCEDDYYNSSEETCVKCWLYFLTDNTLKQKATQKETKQISASDRANQSTVVKLLQNAFSQGLMEHDKADSITIWLDDIIKRNYERE